jgi:hypothetical protein
MHFNRKKKTKEWRKTTKKRAIKNKMRKKERICVGVRGNIHLHYLLFK